MAVSDAILTRLLSLHPKVIDLSLVRMERLLKKLNHPERRLPPVVHIAGTNGKGSTLSFARSIMEAAGLKVHAYTSPHLVKFHERIRVSGALISEEQLSSLLEECEVANGGEPITFFEITTAAAFLAHARSPADYLLLEVGLGGRLDATNVIEKPAACAITSIGLDHQQYLGDTLTQIAGEKAGILKRGVGAVIGRMPAEAGAAIAAVAERVGSRLFVAGRDWDAYDQHGRLVFQDGQGLLDLPMPALRGIHQISNAGNAVALIRLLNDSRISDDHVATGLVTTQWPARLQRLKGGKLSAMLPDGAELWLDGGHNSDAGVVLAQSLAGMPKKPLVLIWGMLNTKDHARFIAPLVKMTHTTIALAIPGEPNALAATELSATVHRLGGKAAVAANLRDALKQAASTAPTPRVLICGSLYLAGHVLAAEHEQAMSQVSGAARR